MDKLSTLEYQVGDKFSISGYCGVGYVTSAGQQINISICLWKPVSKNVTGVIIKNASCIVRQNGSYLVGTASSSDVPGRGVTGVIHEGGIRASLLFDKSILGSTGTNNDAVGILVAANFEFI